MVTIMESWMFEISKSVSRKRTHQYYIFIYQCIIQWLHWHKGGITVFSQAFSSCHISHGSWLCNVGWSWIVHHVLSPFGCLFPLLIFRAATCELHHYFRSANFLRLPLLRVRNLREQLSWDILATISFCNRKQKVHWRRRGWVLRTIQMKSIFSDFFFTPIIIRKKL